MGTAPIDGHGITVGQLFGNGQRYRLGPYQREYDWERKNVLRLLDDLERRFTPHWSPLHDRTNTSSYPPYFLGPFVYFQDDDGLTYLVDGQQRITTLHLLLIHLRRLLLHQDCTTDANRLDGLIRTFQYGRATFTIDIEERAAFLESLLDGRSYSTTEETHPSVRNLQARSGDLERGFPPSLLGEALPYFHDWLLNHVCLVGINALDQRHGWEIFETMNDRGTRLTPVDLLKSFLLGRAEQGRSQLNNAWRDMLTRLTALGSDTPSDFIKDLLIGQYARIGGDNGNDADDIERSFHEWMRRRHSTLALVKPSDFATFITDTLSRMAKHYCLLVRAAQRPEPGMEAVFYNQVNGIRHQHRLIVAATRTDDSTVDFKRKAGLVAAYLDLTYTRRLISGHTVHGSDLDNDIQDLIPTLRTCTSPNDVALILGSYIGRDAFPDFENFGLGSDNRRQVHYLLARLTAFVDSETGNPDRIAEFLGSDHDFQIEHIWANHYDRYQDQAANHREFDTWRNRLGALLLLHRSDNASYRDAPYQVKLEHYPRQNTLAASLHPKAYEKNPRLRKFAKRLGLADLFRPFPGDFPTNAIEVRQKLYQQLAEIIWDPRRLGLVVPDVPRKRKGPERRSRAYYGVEVGHLLDAGLLEAGATLVGRKRKTKYTAIVLADGRIRTESGAVFTSLSGAGAFVKGITACPGWDFWHLQTANGEVPLKDLRAELLRSGRLDT